MNSDDMYNCKHCDKKYKHRSNLSRHIKIKHTEIHIPQNIPFIPQNDNIHIPQHIPQTGICCKYCKKGFAFKSGKYRHQKKCKLNPSNCTDLMLKTEDNETLELKLELKKLKEELTKKFTKLLNEKKCQINTINSHNGNNKTKINTQNNTQNNITIVQLGKEDVLGTLSQDEKLQILNKKFNSIPSLVKLIHCSDKYPQFNNSLITNLQSQNALKYCDEKNKFVKVNKTDLVSDIINYRTINIEEIFEENKDKVSEKTHSKIKELLDIIESNNDISKEIKEEFRYRIIKDVYSNRNKINKEISSK